MASSVRQSIAPLDWNEADEQRLFFEIWNAHEPLNAIAYSNENAGRRWPAGTKKLMALGMRPGLADVTVLYEGKTDFFEFKRQGGRQTAAQKVFQADAYRAGAGYLVTHSAWAALRICAARGVAFNPPLPEETTSVGSV